MPMRVYWKYKLQPPSIAQGDQNKWDLLAREVVGTLISSYGAHGRLEVPEIKWVLIITNSIHSTQYTSTPAYLPDPPSDFPRVWFRDYMYV